MDDDDFGVLETVNKEVHELSEAASTNRVDQTSSVPDQKQAGQERSPEGWTAESAELKRDDTEQIANTTGTVSVSFPAGIGSAEREDWKEVSMSEKDSAETAVTGQSSSSTDSSADKASGYDSAAADLSLDKHAREQDLSTAQNTQDEVETELSTAEPAAPNSTEAELCESAQDTQDNGQEEGGVSAADAEQPVSKEASSAVKNMGGNNVAEIDQRNNTSNASDSPNREFPGLDVSDMDDGGKTTRNAPACGSEGRQTSGLPGTRHALHADQQKGRPMSLKAGADHTHPARACKMHPPSGEIGAENKVHLFFTCNVFGDL